MSDRFAAADSLLGELGARELSVLQARLPRALQTPPQMAAGMPMTRHPVVNPAGVAATDGAFAIDRPRPSSAIHPSAPTNAPAGHLSYLSGRAERARGQAGDRD